MLHDDRHAGAITRTVQIGPNKVRTNILRVLAFVAWIVLSGAALESTERIITTPFCIRACAARGEAFERYRRYSRHGPEEGCLCRGGEQVTPSFWRRPMGLTFFVVTFLPLALALAWGYAREFRETVERKSGSRRPRRSKRKNR
jgi:hypothetical protein